MSADAVSQVEAAKEHITQAVNRLAALATALEELQSAAHAIDSIGMSAAGHLHAVAEVVGSTTARELAAMVTSIVEEIRNSFTPNITEAIAACRDESAKLNAVFEKATTLAAQLGA
jgi:F0F1-type ATP synthase delta subunit